MYGYQSQYGNGMTPYGAQNVQYGTPFSHMSSNSAAGIKWVNGIESAKMYQMPPNSEELLMDQNENRFYIKRTDASGQYTVAAFDFAPVQGPQTVEQLDQSIKSELAELRSKVEEIENVITSPSAAPSSTTNTNTRSRKTAASSKEENGTNDG